MIIPNQKIMYRNVVSKFYKGYANDMQEAFLDFTSELKKEKLTQAAPMFYSVLSNVTHEEMLIEIHVPIEETWLNKKRADMSFLSYFFVDKLLFTRVTEDFEKNTLLAYEELLNMVSENDLEIHAPFFNVPKFDYGKEFVEIYLGAKLTSESLANRYNQPEKSGESNLIF
ncbi:DUF5085 family protein [uncultured Vagococcus sp.]|uniref:DUF5085 family protein n=1 Tax=uncultured Vagococcus sp. TaxID=189676 RepID=UPI0028D2F652|nr:DUF5085 family protein [uncultured Vagococcus sp.]